MNTLISLQEAAALVAEGRPLMFADDEALLRQWTLGRWLWHRLVAAVERLGGAVIPLADDETLHLYDTPSDPERAAALSPTLPRGFPPEAGW